MFAAPTIFVCCYGVWCWTLNERLVLTMRRYICVHRLKRFETKLHTHKSLLG